MSLRLTLQHLIFKLLICVQAVAAKRGEYTDDIEKNLKTDFDPQFLKIVADVRGRVNNIRGIACRVSFLYEIYLNNPMIRLKSGFDKYLRTLVSRRVLQPQF